MNYEPILHSVPDCELMNELFRRGKAVMFEHRQAFFLDNRNVLPPDAFLNRLKVNMVEDMFVRPEVISKLEWPCRSMTGDPYQAVLETRAILVVPKEWRSWKYEIRKIDDIPTERL